MPRTGSQCRAGVSIHLRISRLRHCHVGSSKPRLSVSCTGYSLPCTGTASGGMKLHDHVREWALGYIREGKYSPVGVWFHWIMAALVLFQLGFGWAMSRVPVEPQL